jgi:uncharacterized protein (DUF2267 family)
MDWPLARCTLTRLMARFSASEDQADRQCADAIAEALLRAEKVELLKEVNRDLPDRLRDLEAAS